MPVHNSNNTDATAIMPRGWLPFMKRNNRRTTCLQAMLCGLVFTSCGKPEKNPVSNALDDVELYRRTNDQAGHEFVKTEQFLVPPGSVIAIRELKFNPGEAALTPMQEKVVQQAFNSIEEITENTVGDTNAGRVAEFRKMEFEIVGYPDDSGSGETGAALAEARAKAVKDFLTYLGTPPWRLKSRGAVTATPPGQEDRERSGTVVFIRTR